MLQSFCSLNCLFHITRPIWQYVLFSLFPRCLHGPVHRAEDVTVRQDQTPGRGAGEHGGYESRKTGTGLQGHLHCGVHVPERQRAKPGHPLHESAVQEEVTVGEYSADTVWFIVTLLIPVIESPILIEYCTLFLIILYLTLKGPLPWGVPGGGGCTVRAAESILLSFPGGGGGGFFLLFLLQNCLKCI